MVGRRAEVENQIRTMEELKEASSLKFHRRYFSLTKLDQTMVRDKEVWTKGLPGTLWLIVLQ